MPLPGMKLFRGNANRGFFFFFFFWWGQFYKEVTTAEFELLIIMGLGSKACSSIPQAHALITPLPGQNGYFLIKFQPSFWKFYIYSRRSLLWHRFFCYLFLKNMCSFILRYLLQFYQKDNFTVLRRIAIKIFFSA